MCEGIPVFANNRTAWNGVKTNSHTTSCKNRGVSEDNYRKFEYHWWDKKLVDEDYDSYAESLLKHIDYKKARANALKLVKTKFNTQDKLAKWLKDVPDEWGHLMKPKFKTLAKKVNPLLLTYDKKIKAFKKQPIEKYNPYQAETLPTLQEIKKKLPKAIGAQVWAQVRDQVRDQVGAQVGDQVRAQVWAQVRDQVRDQVWAQVRDQVWAQVRDQVWAQVGDQVRAQVWAQVRDQVWATSYWAIKITLGLPIKHWFFDFLKLGVMIVFVQGKVKVFGKKGKFLGEYDQKDLI